jgi:membrane-associated phospholipid phosphatase
METPKILTKIAQAFSVVFSPLIAPTYAVILAMTATFLTYAPDKAKLMVIGMTMVFTCVVPILSICLLLKLKLIKDPALNDRRERTIPMAVATLSYVGVAIYMMKVNAPIWMASFMLGAGVTALFTITVNCWWKISGHATGMGALTALVFFLTLRGDLVHNNQWLLLATVLIAGIVTTSRLILQRHTPAQVAAGFFSGAIFISISQLLCQ